MRLKIKSQVTAKDGKEQKIASFKSMVQKYELTLW
jgi:hypothetical protein